MRVASAVVTSKYTWITLACVMLIHAAFVFEVH